MYEQLLESSEFYHKRYHNFASKIILPVFGLLLFLLLFLFFMKKEITLKTHATVEPVRVLSQIQSTSNNKIKTNHLREDQPVKKGEVVIEYEALSETIQQSTTQEQLELIKQQREQLKLLKASIEQGGSQFPVADNYGYLQRFEDYLNQRETIASNINQQNSNITNQNASSANAQGAIGEMIGNVTQKINDYQTLRYAIENGGVIDASNSGYSVYGMYTSQLDVLESDIEKNNLKLQTLSQVDAQIQQFNTELANYRIQYSGSGTQQAYNSSLDSQLASLRSQKIAEVSQELAALELKITEAEGSVELQQETLDNTKIIAKESGIIHLNKEVANTQLIPSGTVIASLYPDLTKEKNIKIEAYIPSRDVSSIAIGDKIHFKTQDSSNKEVILRSKISSIDTNATKTEAGSFFKIIAETSVTEKESMSLKYGMEGNLVIITGEKTYLDYYLDKYLN